jgi:hypothetical protein
MKDLSLVQKNMRLSRKLWGQTSKDAVQTLLNLTKRYSFSIADHHLQILDSKWYVTHAGLLHLAKRSGCAGIRSSLQLKCSDPPANRWVFKAEVFKRGNCKGFVGYGDANPSNVSPLVHGAEMRVAETRAVNRALRKAYGIGLCSVEELGWTPRAVDSEPGEHRNVTRHRNGGNGNHGGTSPQPRLRDRLCLLIRQHKLDPNLVKAYAADYCGTASIRDASRDLVEAFVNDIADRAIKDREALICHLNSYTKPQEVHS